MAVDVATVDRVMASLDASGIASVLEVSPSVVGADPLAFYCVPVYAVMVAREDLPRAQTTTRGVVATR